MEARTQADFSHVVRFYEDDPFLLDEVGRFIGDALRMADAGVVIATKAHLDGIEERMRAAGADVAAATAEGRYVPLDAAETLAAFMVEGLPDARRFAEVVGGVLAHASQGGRRLRAFGEMVALLWARGEPQAAIRLEQLWNELGTRYAFSLLCAYPMRGFARAEHQDRFRKICAEHSGVIPVESYAAQSTPDQWLRIIAQLQQTAHALDAEVAERMAIERALRRREKELSDFLENGAVGLHQVGPDGVILWANQAELDMLGYAPHEYIGRHVAEFHVDRPVIDAILNRLFLGETLRDHPARLRCKDGTIRHVLINSNALWEDGRFIHTRCFTRDVTERWRMEVERDELLAREQAARAQAEAASRSKDEFLATLSHELRTPLTAILGWVQMLQSGRLAPSQFAHALAVVERNTRAQVRLIEDLLDVSRIITGKLRLELDPVELVEIVRAVLETVRPAAEAKGVALVSALEPSVGPIAGDADRLQQIVWNLLSNGVKYTPAGGRVEVGLTRTGSRVRITVTDTGIGIRPEFLPHLFDRFSQADSGPARTHTGLGLGLAIVRHLTELHGGTVHAESAGEGRGATFTVDLPLARPAVAEPRPARAAAAPANGPPPATRLALDGLRILVVDDHDDARELLGAILRLHGGAVHECGSMAAALEALERLAFDVLVSDIGLPGGSGYDLIRAVRARAAPGRGIPALAVSAYARPEDRVRALEAGYERHISKPVDPERLVRLVAALARRTDTGRSR
jgi:PAS domain S-box-containing protein